MGQFRLEIVGTGGHGCERKALPGERLYTRCGKFGCPDCMSYDFVQQMKQKGFTLGEATFQHFPGTPSEVVDDLLKNERRSGQF